MRPDIGGSGKMSGYRLPGWNRPPVLAWTAAVVLVFGAVSCMSPEDGAAPTSSMEPEAAPPSTSTTVESALTTTTTSTPPTSAQSTSPPTTTEPAQFYVSLDGSDENDGTEDSPWRTLAYAFLQLEPGDTLNVRGGTYEERVTVDVTPGTEEEPIVVQAVPGEEPVIQGLLWLRHPDYWILDGVNVTWDESNDDEEHMVKMTDGSGWVLRNSELWGAQSFAALLVAGTEDGTPSDWRIVGNCIHDTLPSNDANQDQLIYVNTGTDPANGVIENNLLFGAENGTAVKLGGPSEDEGGAHGVTVRNNTIINTAQGVFIAWGASNNIVTGNFFAGTQKGYGHIRGYQLEGANNVASDNGGDVHEPFILNDQGYTGVQDAGGNSPDVDVEVAEPSCDSHPVISGYGLQTALDTMPTNS